MPEAPQPSAWRWLGRLLPPSLRELMYEPLCDDLWRAHLTEALGGGRLLLWLRFVGCFSASVWYSVPRYFIERDRVTLLGKGALVVATGVTLAAMVSLAPWVLFLATHL